MGVHCGIYTGSYKYIIYMNLPPLLYSFIPPSLPPGIVSTGIIFAFIYRCTFYRTIFTAYLPSLIPLVPALPPGQDLFYPPVLQFCGRKKRK
jgi:hypothetical protein